MSLLKRLYSRMPSNESALPTLLSTMERGDDLAVVIHTCDKYKFCWSGWHYHFNLFWDFDIPANVYFLNEESDVSFQGIEQLKTGVGEWSSRLKRGLTSIREKNVFYLQEDVWLQKRINVERSYQIFCQLEMDRLQLSPTAEFYTLFKEFTVGDVVLQKFAMRSDYLISHQPSIWNKEFFLSCLDKEESPWEHEIEGTRRLRKQGTDVNVYLAEVDWYKAVCRRGQFTKEGLELQQTVVQSMSDTQDSSLNYPV